jgi:hypothetical protein
VLLEAQVRPPIVDRGDVRPECRCAFDALLGRDVVKHNVFADNGHDRVDVVPEPSRSIPLDKGSHIGMRHRRGDSARSDGMRPPSR